MYIFNVNDYMMQGVFIFLQNALANNVQVAVVSPWYDNGREG